MTRKLITVDEFRSSARDGARPEGTVLRVATGSPKPATDGSRNIRFVFSDGSVDRAGDTISADGWDLDGFLPNPVALWAHDSFLPPIGRASNVGPVDGKLVGDIEFMAPEISPFADSIYRMVSAGFINAVSVGFIPREWCFVNDKDRPYGIDFTKQELLEISVCPVPCNPNALAEARAKGIDTAPLREWAEKLLDGEGGGILVPRALLEETFKAAKTPRTVRQKYLKPPEKPAPAPAKDMGDDPDAPVVPPGNCGRAKDAECGMKDPAECAVHAPEPGKSIAVDAGKTLEMIAEATKAGRRISAANADKLNQAKKHIDDVLNSNDPEDPNDSSSQDAAGTAADTGVDEGKAARVRRARALKLSIT